MTKKVSVNSNEERNLLFLRFPKISQSCLLRYDSNRLSFRTKREIFFCLSDSKRYLPAFGRVDMTKEDCHFDHGEKSFVPLLSSFSFLISTSTSALLILSQLSSYHFFTPFRQRYHCEKYCKQRLSGNILREHR